MTIAKHYKCGICGWVHFELSLEAAQAHTDAVNAALRADDKPVAVERYFVCGRCGASRATFVPALPGDAPLLSNLRGIVLQSAKESNIEILCGLTNSMTEAEADQLALNRDTVASVRKFDIALVAFHEVPYEYRKTYETVVQDDAHNSQGVLPG